MNLHAKLLEREAADRPVTIGLIGAGKFGTMFLAQVRRTRGMHLVGVADLNVERARAQLRAAGWSDEAFAAAALALVTLTPGGSCGFRSTRLSSALVHRPPFQRGLRFGSAPR